MTTALPEFSGRRRVALKSSRKEEEREIKM